MMLTIYVIVYAAECAVNILLFPITENVSIGCRFLCVLTG